MANKLEEANKAIKSITALVGLVTTVVPTSIKLSFLVGKISLLVGQLFGANISDANAKLVAAERTALNKVNKALGITEVEIEVAETSVELSTDKKIVASGKALLGILISFVPVLLTMSFLVGHVSLLIGQLFSADISDANEKLVTAERKTMEFVNKILGI